VTKKSFYIVRRIILILAIIVVIFVTYRAARIVRTPSFQKAVEVPLQATSSETALVTRVIDGDTIEVAGNPASPAGRRRVRYIGINTPEMTKCFGSRARDENTSLVNGKIVRLVSDVSDKDTYGRLLRYVYVGDEFVNDTLARQGFAVAEPIKPDTLFAQQFLSAQQEAKRDSRGLWSACP
jgi:micrococcal nuclease